MGVLPRVFRQGKQNLDKVKKRGSILFGLCCMLLFLFAMPTAGIYAQETTPETEEKAKKPAKKEIEDPNLGRIVKILQVRVQDDSTLENAFELKFSAHKNGIPIDSNKVEESIRLIEMYRGEPDTIVFNDLKFRRDSSDNKSPVSVWMMLDISGSMRQTFRGSGSMKRIDFAKQQITATVRDNRLPIGSTYISSFDETVSPPIKLDTNHLEKIEIPSRGKYTHLYESLDHMLDLLEADSSTEKVIVLVADGENDLRDKSIEPVTKDSVLSRIAKLDTTFRIYPVAIDAGIDSTTLAELINASANPRDTFVYNITPDIPIVLGPQLPWTHSVFFSSENVPFSGRSRELKLEVAEIRDSTVFHVGSIMNPVGELTEWPRVATAAGLIAIILLLVFAALVPQIRWWDFKRKYVRPYWKVKKSGLIKFDPLTKAPFHDKDQVVVRCEHMTSLATWKYESNTGKQKYHCIYYPNKCQDGEGHTKHKNFFSQKGFFRALNWIWFGGLGGLIGWGLWAVWETLRPRWDYLAKVQEFSQSHELLSLPSNPHSIWSNFEYGQHFFERLVAPVFDEFAVGVLFGSALIFALTWVKERGHGKKDSSIWRILLRTLLGIVFSVIVFAIGAALKTYVWPEHRFWPGFVSYALLGIAACLVLTIAGKNLRWKGYLFGAGAGIICYLIYVFGFLGMVPTIDFEWAKMLIFFLMGGLMGLMIMWGVALLEDFHFDYLTPEWFNRSVPVSRWLKEGEQVTLGRGIKDKVPIKKDKAVQEGHAKLSLKNDRVFIEPIGHVTVNESEVPKGKRYPLHHLDRISFGEKSFTTLRYLEKRTGEG